MQHEMEQGSSADDDPAQVCAGAANATHFSRLGGYTSFFGEISIAFGSSAGVSSAGFSFFGEISIASDRGFCFNEIRLLLNQIRLLQISSKRI